MPIPQVRVGEPQSTIAPCFLQRKTMWRKFIFTCSPGNVRSTQARENELAATIQAEPTAHFCLRYLRDVSDIQFWAEGVVGVFDFEVLKISIVSM